ncbi:hypothetical protein PMI01_03234 [Caulobacter sp. AP07]|uniref:hypothetical protein n=1 Tax=Caulobacter sp. AP07 TaxID=1144304 RepID=UPI0002720C34|nr:hypothetical protein [Caulobacter sp. AP07]EJL30117.1 hypothetical protein PMI01_03234 [Caulobacter sp. AP07]
MPVVINEFEAVADAPPRDEAGGAAEGGGEAKLELADLRHLIETLARDAARAWAH